MDYSASSDPRAILATLQLADSFFPTGAYAHSMGLEGMIRRGLVNDQREVEELLANQLAWSVLPSDGVALLNAHRVASTLATPDQIDELLAIDRRLAAMKLAPELRRASCQVGRRLVVETSAFSPGGCHATYAEAVSQGDAPGNAAVALGVVAATLGIPAPFALLAFVHGFLVGVLGAALRLLPLTHTDGQRILHALQLSVTDLADEIAGRHWTDMAAFAPELELCAIAHEDDDPRFFAS